ncbi:hypothetical protein ASL10_04045 [Frigoribacterium sp. Leaf8]|nr:hypothetical protein ASL10_04045 [Frigoribacterium sp. Leaf8]
MLVGERRQRVRNHDAVQDRISAIESSAFSLARGCHFSSTPGRSCVVDDEAPSDGEQPRLSSILVELQHLGTLPCSQHRLLNDVLGQRRVPSEAVCVTAKRPAVALEQCRQELVTGSGHDLHRLAPVKSGQCLIQDRLSSCL